MTKLFWINVDSHADRRSHMESHLDCLGYINQRVSALTPTQLPSHPEVRSELEYACLFSHLQALRVAASEWDVEWALISEDDIYVCGLFDISELSKTAPTDAEVLQLTSINAGIYEPLIENKRAPDNLWLPWKHHHSGTQLYAVNVQSVKQKLPQLGVEISVDLAKQRLVELGNFSFTHVADEYIYQLFKTYTCTCLLYTSPSPRDRTRSRMPSSA